MPHHFSLVFSIVVLFLLIAISAFFSASETGLMSLNRYKLKHLARMKHQAARRVYELIERPDRLLGAVLIGNTFANVLVSVVASNMSEHWFGEDNILVVSFLIALIILIFAEILPKTFAAIYPQKIAFWVSWPLTWILKLLYPLVWAANFVSNRTLALFGIKSGKARHETLSLDELRSVVLEASTMIPSEHQDMLLRILDLESITVDDVMIPRNEIYGIDLEEEWEEIKQGILDCPHTRLVFYKKSIDNIEATLELRAALNLLAKEKLTKEALLEASVEAYFIPEGTPLTTQLLNFRNNKARMGIVVDEYGEIVGLVTLEDILEEIAGEFTTDIVATVSEIRVQSDGSCIADGSVSLRELNRKLSWQLPIDGPKTLNGLITERLESIPKASTCVLIQRYPIEIIRVQDNTVKTARISPALQGDVSEED